MKYKNIMKNKKLIFLIVLFTTLFIILGLALGFIILPSLKLPIVRSPDVGDPDICRVTGCSSQVCASEDVITTCEYRPEFACYRSAQCEIQLTGECGWTMDNVLRQCLEEARQVNL